MKKILTSALLFLVLDLSSTFAEPVQIEVNVGDRVTKIQFSTEEQKYFMGISSNDFSAHQTQIGETNFSYIQKRLDQISKLGSKKDSCERDRVEVKVKQNDHWTPRFELCLLAQTEQAESMRSLLNTLSIAY